MKTKLKFFLFFSILYLLKVFLAAALIYMFSFHQFHCSIDLRHKSQFHVASICVGAT